METPERTLPLPPTLLVPLGLALVLSLGLGACAPGSDVSPAAGTQSAEEATPADPAEPGPLTKEGFESGDTGTLKSSSEDPDEDADGHEGGNG